MENTNDTSVLLSASIVANQLSAALEDLKTEYTPTARHPVVDSKHGTALNIAIQKMKLLFGPVLDKASELLSTSSSPKVVAPPPPKVGTTSVCHPGVSEATN